MAFSGEGIRVALSKPADGETCPLTLSPIAEDGLEFLPGVSFFPMLPDVRRMTLPCGHAFGAMSLVYHFARQSMACPFCRAGPRARICADSIPHHFRVQMIREVNTQHLRDIEEQTAADAAVARELEMGGAAEDSDADSDEEGVGVVVIDFERVYVSVYYHAEDSAIPTLGMQFRLELDQNPPEGPNAPFTFHMPFPDRRLLALQFSDFPPRQISLVAHTRSATNHPIELGRTPPFASNSQVIAEPRLIPAGGSHFEFFQIQNPFTVQFIRWSIPSATFLRMFLARAWDGEVIEVD
jgi:hypothetical protein